MAKQLYVVKRADAVGSIVAIYDIGIRDTVDPSLNFPRVAELRLNQAVYDAMDANSKTEFNDAGITLTAIRSVTAFQTATDV